MLIAEFGLHDGTHGGLFGGRGALPIKTEALVTDAARDVFLNFGSAE
jgi:hypothetical protein